MSTASPAVENISWQERTEDFSDRWNPMLVREMRRMLKSRSFGATFVLLLLTCWGASLFFVISRGSSIHFQESGREMAWILFAILSFPLNFVVPLSLFAGTAEEHNEQTLEVLTVTTLKTGQILWGYFWCGVVHASVYYCAILPFISFSFLLRGLGLAEILACLFAITLIAILAGTWGMMLGACATGTIKRSVFSLFTVFGGLAGFSVTNQIIAGIMMSGAYGGGVFAFAGATVCFLMIALPFVAIASGIGRQQFELTDPMVSPYNVRLDENGKVIKFVPRHLRTEYANQSHAERVMAKREEHSAKSLVESDERTEAT